MWIKQVIIDGFKSYAHRTVVGPFDREFNAITGLNGSGKSNVLDAICFVFAISNLAQVRVHDMRELIYKSGQAGIHKASVTIDFDNTDKASSPPGYVECKNITVSRQIHTGGNKFFINGSTSTLSNVQTLFHSVQLNVNNPHFLIMQGTISKVLNMKPASRLSMLEEAAGTRMFEQKKTEAQQRVQKKDVKLAEIDRQLNEDMKPTLEKRERDRREYDKYIQGKNQIEQLSRMKLAYDYEQLQATCTRLVAEVEEARTAEGQSGRDLSELKDTITELSNEIQNKKSQNQTSLTYTLGSSQKDYDDAYKVLVTKQTDMSNGDEDTVAQQKLVKQLVADQKKTSANMVAHRTKAEKARTELEEWDGQQTELELAVDNLQRQLTLMKSGIAASSEGVSLTEQLQRYKKQLSTAEGSIRQAEMIKKQRGQQLQVKRKQADSGDADYESTKQALVAAEQAYAQEETRLKEQTGFFSEDRVKELRELIDEKQRVIATVEHELRRLQTVVQTRVEVQYDTPNNRTPQELVGGVKGVVLKLLKVKDQRYTVALTQAAGRGLYNIVVDNEKTGKEVVKRVRNRVTVIPLNQIQDGVIPKKALALAEEVAKQTSGTAELALDLIEYDESVGAAMRFVFGKRLVCSDLKAASNVTFHRDVKQVSVTVEGEVVQPGGVMQGGSTRDLDQNLAHYQRFMALTRELDVHHKELQGFEKELQTLQEAAQRFREQETALTLEKKKLDNLRYKMSSNQRHQLMEQASKLEADVAEAEESLASNTKKAETLRVDIDKLQGEMSQGGDLEAQMKTVSRDIQKAKDQQKALAPKRTEARGIVAEADATEHEFQTDLDRLQADEKEETEKLQQMQAKAARSKKEMGTLQAIVKEKEAHMHEVRDRLLQANTGLQAMEQELTALRDNEAEMRVTVQDAKRRVGELENLSRDKAARLAALEKTDFVVQNKHNFGKAGTDLDWRPHVRDFERLESLKQQHAAAGKTVNHKVVSMYEAVAEQYNDVLTKRNQVELDKEHVLSTIAELNDQKKKTITKTFDQVSKDFSSIFSSLLHGAKAQLVAEREKDGEMITGISIRAAMGDSWKESLTELSGGQRSLLALSYILSLLKYKPAPVYILDEVDAALDLSHTQNIGKMLSNHFKNSQFLVVSLKEGMFNNANVLFRVRLVDGQSQVTRHDNTVAKRGAKKRTRDADPLDDERDSKK